MGGPRVWVGVGDARLRALTAPLVASNVKRSERGAGGALSAKTACYDVTCRRMRACSVPRQ